MLSLECRRRDRSTAKLSREIVLDREYIPGRWVWLGQISRPSLQVYSVWTDRETTGKVNRSLARKTWPVRMESDIIVRVYSLGCEATDHSEKYIGKETK